MGNPASYSVYVSEQLLNTTSKCNAGAFSNLVVCDLSTARQFVMKINYETVPRQIWLLCMFCVLWIVITTFAPEPIGQLQTSPNDEGSWWICPRRTVCAENLVTMVLLGISRVSAYFVYPLIILMFISKANHINTALSRSALG